MTLLNAKDREIIKTHFTEMLDKPVKLVLFTQTIACQFCRETQQILTEVADISDKIQLEVLNFVTDKKIAERYGIDKIPATIVMQEEKDFGVRFFGIPSGYEFTSLIEAIVDVSRGKTNLSSKTLELLGNVTVPVHLQVFVTPTCPYCPTAVRLAHSLAIASDYVKADMVESVEFPHLANKYQVYGVPRTVINETTHMEGAAPEPLLMAKVLQALGQISSDEVDKLMKEMETQLEQLVQESEDE